MSRPKNETHISHTDRNYRTTDAVSAAGCFVLTLDDQPIGLRIYNSLVDYPGPKYPRCLWVTPAYAFSRATSLNRLFRTDRFGVAVATGFEPLTEAESRERYGSPA